MGEAQQELQEWKQKYFDAIGKLETREKQWGEVEQLLRLGLSRLSLVADDSDPELNRQLESLREALRGGSSEQLQAELRAISDTILRLDEARKAVPEPTEMEVPREEARPGLLGKLFGARQASGGESPAGGALQLAKRLLGDLIGALVKEEASRQRLNARLQASEQEAQLQRLAGELAELLRATDEPVPGEELPLNEVLVRLLERLDIPAELGDEVEALKAMLLRSLAPQEVERVIAAIAELIAEMRRRMQGEKAELENFLKQLTTRLHEIDRSFHSNVATQRESFRDGQALDNAVKVQVEGIEASVQQAEELTALKALVQQRVDTIRTHMHEFRSAEEQRRQHAEQQVAELTERLEAVQGESQQLRQRLLDERNQAMIDPLTGIPNRLAYDERLAQEAARWQRYGSPLVLAVWDVDRFKSVNDTYGHQAGDKVLSVIAKVLHTQSRETDFVARFGGEEFVLLMPETSLENAVVAAEHLRQAVEATEFHFRGSRVPITISCGLSEFRLGDDAEQVFARADKALYGAKSGGRNCCHKG